MGSEFRLKKACIIIETRAHLTKIFRTQSQRLQIRKDRTFLIFVELSAADGSTAVTSVADGSKVVTKVPGSRVDGSTLKLELFKFVSEARDISSSIE
ncbi:hypothetical protein QYM36_014104 [Artemia franciscana]|uniref:Uncharacterized protein n=1 Tax=Artemia franciscana TaxID=6661 RepID=A0AA88HFX2_ARTSF|nr:hypothetical protein QYM36_014104 [Artemia franciscana]